MKIQSIPMWEGTGNNYAYIVSDGTTKEAVVIDPANPPEVLPVLKPLTDAGDIKLTAIVNTHHHRDHAGGNAQMLKTFSVPVIGGKDCDKVSKMPAHNSTWTMGQVTVKALHTPCHTQDSICYFFEDGAERAVFTGDTLFIGGCGRFFEGTAPEMDSALNKVLGSLPDNTKVYPGHEYTKGNVKFAASVIQDEATKQLQDLATNNKETPGKSTIGDEKGGTSFRYNVFMRNGDPAIQKIVGSSDPVDVMKKLRSMKDSF